VKLLVFLVIVVLAYVIPYTVLTDVPRLWGAYLFWSALTIVAVVFMCFELSGWRGHA
jgi:hypothetical protein